MSSNENALRLCALCQEARPLSRSHIIPRFFTEGGHQMFPTGKDGSLQPFVDATHTDPTIKLGRMQKGFWDSKLGVVQHLLCNECEQRFSKLESYVRRYFYGTTTPIRLQLSLKLDPFFRVDYSQFKLFQLSLLWRASTARGSFFEKVELGEKHTERIRRMLLENDPGHEDEYACTLCRFTSTPEIDKLLERWNAALETMMFAPIVHRFEGCRFYTFIFGGLVWGFCVTSARVPSILEHSYLKKDGVFYLSPLNAQGFLAHFAKKVVKTGNYPPPAGWGEKGPSSIVKDFTIFRGGTC